MSRFAPTFALYDLCQRILADGSMCHAIVSVGCMPEVNGVPRCPLCSQEFWLDLRIVEMVLNNSRSYALVEANHIADGHPFVMMGFPK